MPPEEQPATVPPAQQVGAFPSRWRWVKPWAWTIRMVTALEQGAKGDTWFRLFDKVFAERNLWAAFPQVAQKKGAAGGDHVTVSEFGRRLPDRVWELSDALPHGTYQPPAVRRVHIPQPGSTETRPLGIPTVRDRVVPAAVVHVIEPIFERDFAEHGDGFRPERGGQDALRRVDTLIKAGHVHVVDADLKGDFDTIPHDRGMARWQERITDGSVLTLIEAFWKANIGDGTAAGTPETGAPQGAVLSPLRSHIDLDPRDHLLARSGDSLMFLLNDVNRTLRGGFADFQHRGKWTFPRWDGWVRGRIRSLLRKRHKRRGRACGWDHPRWRHAFFAEQGRSSLVAAQALACRSSRR